MGRPKGSKNKKTWLTIFSKVDIDSATNIIDKAQPTQSSDTKTNLQQSYFQHIHRVKLNPDRFRFFLTKNGIAYESKLYEDVYSCHKDLLIFFKA